MKVKLWGLEWESDREGRLTYKDAVILPNDKRGWINSKGEVFNLGSTKGLKYMETIVRSVYQQEDALHEWLFLEGLTVSYGEGGVCLGVANAIDPLSPPTFKASGLTLADAVLDLAQRTRAS